MDTLAAGLWDNDKSYNRVARFTKVAPKPGLLDFLTSRAVELWFGEIDGSVFARSVERRSKEVIHLPKPLFNALSEIARNPKMTAKGSRSERHRQVLGPRANGFRIQPLFAMTEVTALLEPLSETLAARLDRAFKSRNMLSEDGLSELGVLLELTNAQVFQSAERAARWEAGFMKMSERTTEDRPFWDEFVSRVRPSFSMLSKPA